MVAGYKVALIEELAARLFIHVPSVILTNLVLKEAVVPEFLQRDCTAQNLATALLPLMNESSARQRQIDAFARLDAIMELGKTKPSDSAAAVVLACANSRSGPPHVIEVRRELPVA
jgi:lipid-A-disaccharide synthase